MTHNPFDEFAKSLVLGRQARFGHAETELELTRDALYADLAWEPDRALLPRKARDLLDRMARVASLWEFSHRAPDFLSVVTCVEKLRVWHARRVADAKAHGRKAPTKAPLWLICAGTPAKLRSEITFRAMKRWPRGFYEGPSSSKLRLVLVRELHVAPDTLLLRLMGAGAVLDRAFAEVEALPVGAEARILAEEHIERIWSIRARRGERSVEGKQYLAKVRAEHQAWLASLEAKAQRKGFEKGVAEGLEKGLEKGREKGVAEGREKGVAEGLEKGVAEGLRTAVVALCEASGIALDAARRGWIERADAQALQTKLNEILSTRVWS